MRMFNDTRRRINKLETARPRAEIPRDARARRLQRSADAWQDSHRLQEKFFYNRVAEKSTKYRAWYLALTFSSTIFCRSRCSFITRCFGRGNAGVTPG